MFLDDELLKMAKEADITTLEGIQKLNVDLCQKCEVYYKSKLTDNMPHPSQIKATLDKTFNLWDSFVRMAKKDSDKQLNILAPLFEKHSFKHQFLQNEEMNRIYTNLIGFSDYY
jgi:spore cortex formation protein SpoVR/YcgB (stage V sporulation)